MRLPLLYCCIAAILISLCSVAQDSIPVMDRVTNYSLYDRISSFPDKLLNGVNKKADAFNNKLAKQTEKYLQKLAREEQQLKKQLAKTDSTKAKELFGESEKIYSQLQSTLDNPPGGRALYSGHLDSVSTALRFLGQNSLLNQTTEIQQKFKSTLGNYTAMQGKLNSAEEIKKYLQQRQEFLKQQLQNTPIGKQFTQWQKDFYYYRSQIDEYRNILNEPDKLEAKALQLLRQVPAFQRFFNKYSMLAQIFPEPATSDEGLSSFAGLQTREMVQQEVQDRLGTGPNVRLSVQQGMADGQSQLKQLKDKLNQLGTKDAETDMPNFKPNTQKSKSFLKRLEYGTNFQAQRANYFFPATGDIGLSVGYKMSEKSIIGIGTSYKFGLGQGWNNIELTQEGAGVRSYLDCKLKGSIWISGGFEMNYRTRLESMDQLMNIYAWQQSGLIGLSKVISLKSKFFKKTKVQLLWDFLSYQQVPQTQPILFRFGYSFK